MEDLFQETREAEKLPSFTKQEIISRYNKRAAMVQDGEVDAIPVYIELKELIESLLLIQDNIKQNTINQAKEQTTFEGYQLRISSRKIWRFDHIKSYLIQKESLKNFEEYLKNATLAAISTNQSEIINHETGECFPLAEQNNSSEFITITKIKQK